MKHSEQMATAAALFSASMQTVNDLTGDRGLKDFIAGCIASYLVYIRNVTDEDVAWNWCESLAQLAQEKFNAQLRYKALNHADMDKVN